MTDSVFMYFTNFCKAFPVQCRVFTGLILSQMKRFGLTLDNHSCLTLSVDVVCLSSDISVVPIPVKTIPELFSRAFWVFPETGDAELVDRDNLG